MKIISGDEWAEVSMAARTGDGMRLMRSRRDRWIYGVCGGIARRYGWSSTAVRLVTVLLAIFIPGPNIVVILAYFLLAFLLPEAEDF